MKLWFVFFLPFAMHVLQNTENLLLPANPDTLKVVSAGSNNRVVIDSLHLCSATNDTIQTNSVQGTINQEGENNSVEINTGVEAPNNKKQNTNKFQNSNSKNQITIKQTGKNNSVKINQR